jgi:hypothetical protein
MGPDFKTSWTTLTRYQQRHPIPATVKIINGTPWLYFFKKICPDPGKRKALSKAALVARLIIVSPIIPKIRKE